MHMPHTWSAIAFPRFPLKPDIRLVGSTGTVSSEVFLFTGEVSPTSSKLEEPDESSTLLMSIIAEVPAPCALEV